MSQIPIAAAMLVPASSTGSPIRSPDRRAGWPGTRSQEISQFRGADLIAAKWDISRAEMEAYALASHQRAVAAIDGGAFAGEITSYGPVSVDECPRRDTSAEKMVERR